MFRWAGVARGALILLGVVVLGLGSGCQDDELNIKVDGGVLPGGLSPQQAAQVVARVGDKTITLGDFAAALERLNQYDRLRYQTKQRRRELLQEMIDIELLAQEARRRGLDKKPAVREAIRQILRDAELAKARQNVPAPAEIPLAEVQAYYEKNRSHFREPERRRVAAIVMTDKDAAQQVLESALAAKTGKQWGELFLEHSISAPKGDQRDVLAPTDLAGDLGIVGPPGDPQSTNSKVPPPVQQAVFTLAKIGDVHDKLVEHGGKLYIVRLVGHTKGHTRSLAEADRSIRVELLQEKIHAAEQQLAQDLRERFPVQINEQALDLIELPSAALQPAAPADAGAPPDGGSSL